MTSYSAIVLDKKSHNKLVETFSPTWENKGEGWEPLAHHFTITMGSLPQNMKHLIGQQFTMKVLAFAGDNKVKAVEVERVLETKNKVAHITLAVNRKNGGKPKNSNDLTNWVSIQQEIYVSGTLQEIS